MCGRYSLGRTDRMDWASFGVAPLDQLVPRWNIAPGTDVLAIRHAGDDHETAWLRWGLIPSWAKDPAIGHKLANARAETAHEKPSFRAAVKARRCLLPADGFYEWQVVAGTRKKQPWRIERTDGAILALGALWEFWRDAAGEKIETCTVLTVPVNEALAHIHDRLPLILEPRDWNRWLSPHTTVDKARELLHAVPDDTLSAWRISDRVNTVSHDDPSLVTP
ncbi:MAG: SOS response-associated peptidase [Gemmatimonadetes bacterium]|nr:SOS response-associated peptidase [Gemmatimonadota bacterium]MBI3566738.1 SOS response-associated peptidase [Gemmatimonadota bacterium]